MYADDLILLSASVVELQKMIDLCLCELAGIDAKKSSVCRIGEHFKQPCANLTIMNVEIPWSSRICYLGITIKSASKFLIDLKSARGKFYRSFNAVYSKVAQASEVVIVSLVKSCCVPALMYGLESVDLSTSLLKKINEPLYHAIEKIFKTFDRNVAQQCMYYMNCAPLSHEYCTRKLKFLKKLSGTNNIIVQHFHILFGKGEIVNICNKFDLSISDASCAKKKLWWLFANSLNL